MGPGGGHRGEQARARHRPAGPLCARFLQGVKASEQQPAISDVAEKAAVQASGWTARDVSEAEGGPRHGLARRGGSGRGDWSTWGWSPWGGRTQVQTATGSAQSTHVHNPRPRRGRLDQAAALQPAPSANATATEDEGPGPRGPEGRLS